ncbi:hypothetical protein P175DRAFT_0504296 [Aspergillus ochraceoroseus IBT 24754]|uniref:Uncharacterized protein n=2 Tax=Aspergillus ochraceoroseus TaxID=138278 RepID=A0A2T5LQ22_9EURO|nr:uncharacterized protein P175DRAFT_0504296 [Aspergillus ochraceoroseus IBT 24754]KKK22732.1 hypothetical protein AOCH_004169 [Aspergillus ochraceoroseus]PTU18375.1 hypothetical protein P175DRAFT_0504296 [Aspergillus ochraceoroseus IBT 24754]
MPPRLRLSSARVPQPVRSQRLLCQYELPIALRYASTAATVTTPAPSIDQMTVSAPSIARTPSSQPPSHRNPEYRRSQLLRQYTSLIRTTPLMVFLQHDNLQSVEWAAIRRELNKAMEKVDAQIAAAGRSTPALAPHVKVQIVQTSIFEVALRIVEYFQPETSALTSQTSARAGSRDDPSLTHDLSRAAHDAVRNMKGKHELASLLVGPVAVLSIPHMSPEHLKAAMSILAPKSFGYPAPTRKANPSWHEFPVQNGLNKLSVLAARMDDKVFDVDQTKWVGSIEGGMDGLRSQLIMALQSMGSSITNALDGASRSIYFTLESRRSVLEDEQKGASGENKSDS